MADIIEINISVVDKGNNLEKAVTKTQTLQTKLKRLAKEIDAGAISDKKRSQTLIALGRELKKVTDYTGTQAYGQVRKYLNQQLKSIEADKNAAAYKQRLAKVESYLAERARRTSAAMKQQAVVMDANTAAVKRFENESRKRMRRVEIIVQQAGYQFGDLAVQIQSGTNAAVALGQQGSQLLGFFGPTGAIAGAALAITTAFIAPFMKAKEEAADMKNEVMSAFDAYKGKVDDLKDAIEDLNSARKAQKLTGLGISNTQVDGLKVEVGLQRQLLNIEKQRLDITITRAKAEVKARQIVIDSLYEDLRATVADVSRKISLDTTLDATQKAAAQQRLLEQQLQEEKEIYEANADLILLQKQQTVEVRLQEALLKRLNSGLDDQLDKADDIVKSNEKLNDMIEDTLNGTAAYYREQEKIAREVKKTADLKRLDAKLLEAELQYGKKSLEYAKVAYDIEQAKYRIQIDNGERSTAQIKEMLQANGEVLSAQYDLTEQERIMIDLTREMNNQWDGVKDTIEETNKLLKESQKIMYTLPAGTQVMMDKYASRVSSAAQVGKAPIFGENGESIYKTPPKGATSETAREALNNLLKEAENRQKVAGLIGEQARAEELLFKLQQTNADKRNPLNEKEIQDYFKKIHALEEQTLVLERQKKVQEDLAQTVGSSMETAMMGIVDGTKTVKDAFRDMARDIIAHLYKVLVVQRMVRAFGGYLSGSSNPVVADIGSSLKTYGQANGGVWSNGSPVTAYANGGIVGSPTYFPMSGGRTGLMGEAGPEAIMPLKRGKNGKLGVQAEGGTGNVTINQTFAFQANGDESVKKIIAQQAPKIAQMTQQQIMDSRRRGGQMKAVFG